MNVETEEKARISLKEKTVWLRVEADFSNQQDRATFYYRRTERRSSNWAPTSTCSLTTRGFSWVHALPSSTMPPSHWEDTQTWITITYRKLLKRQKTDGSLSWEHVRFFNDTLGQEISIRRHPQASGDGWEQSFPMRGCRVPSRSQG